RTARVEGCSRPAPARARSPGARVPASPWTYWHTRSPPAPCTAPLPLAVSSVSPRSAGPDAASIAPPATLQGEPAGRVRSAHPAVDADDLAVDVGGLFRAQERHQRGDLLRLSRAAGGHQLLHHFGGERIGGPPPLDHARRDHVDGDAAAGHLAR